jgi:sialidase-1
VIASGPGHGIQLESGRLVLPVWMSDGSGTEFGAGKLGHRPSEVASFYSDDHGQTWQCGDVVAHTDERIINPSETVPVELSDGRVLFNIRSESPENRRLVAVSPDGAHGWSAPQFDDALLEPVCMGSILRLAHQGAGRNLIVFANPDNLENALIPAGGNLAHDRKRLTVVLSADDCRTWPTSRVLEAGPSGYSDLAETPDGTVLCVYECGMVERMTDTRSIVVARFDLDWLSTGAP